MAHNGVNYMPAADAGLGVLSEWPSKNFWLSGKAILLARPRAGSQAVRHL
jgi:hypothetical protein